MPSKLISAAAALLAAGALAACGSSSSSTSTATSSASSGASNATAAKYKAVPVHGKTVTLALAGRKGHALTVSDTKHFRVKRGATHAHLTGLPAGADLVTKLNIFLGINAQFWGNEFTQTGGSLPAAHAALIQDQPVACGSTQLTSSSAPLYCVSNQTIYFPLGTVEGTIAPLGDAALALLTADLYSYHVENALGAFSKGYSSAQLEEMDSCFSGVFFFAALQGQSGVALQPTDEQVVNGLLSVLAPAAGANTTAGSVSASELAAAFNKGIDSPVGTTTPRPSVCVPS